jgi:hypothetical protein
MISQRGPQHNNGFPCLLEKGLKFEDFRSWDMIISYLGSHCLPPRQELYVDLDQGPAPAVPGKEAAHGPSAESGGASDPDGERDGSKVPKDSDLGHYAQEAIKRVPIPKPESAPHVPEKSTLPGVEGREFAEWCVDAEEEEDLFGLKRKLQEARAAVAAARVAAGQAPLLQNQMAALMSLCMAMFVLWSLSQRKMMLRFMNSMCKGNKKSPR